MPYTLQLGGLTCPEAILVTQEQISTLSHMYHGAFTTFHASGGSWAQILNPGDNRTVSETPVIAG